MIVIADRLFADFKVVQQLLSLPRVFTSYQRRFLAQDTQCAKRDVLQIPNRSGNEIERARQSSSVSLKSRGLATKTQYDLQGSARI